MSVESSANPVEGSAELYVESETVHFYREPPPPYSLSDVGILPPVSTQPGAETKETVLLKLTLRSGPTFCQCIKCGHKGLSIVQYVNTNKTHLLAGCICGITW